ncbi:hypothetical protein [Ciceribacter thiooxidans]|uniref:HTH cro/C1-type domain-containing protein n=1 Tax=Ciceribacter thiooxidans TaxID=1969821 RepID=A0ABV7HXI1_9HYPH|nr:hypothetical protein [Ciceribacter thiooxidans]
MSGLPNGRDPARADYDWRAFARALRARRGPDTRGIRAIGAEIGVTASDLSRAMGGQMVSAGKVIALCRWLGVPVERFYLPPEDQAESTCFSSRHVERGGKDEGVAA